MKLKKTLKDAQTSPRRDDESPNHRQLNEQSPVSSKLKKNQLLSPNKVESPPSPSSPMSSSRRRTTLEKSNSMTESKNSKQLRTTKSLSPRPPIKHQHEREHEHEHNKMMSVKISPTDNIHKKSIKMDPKCLINDNNLAEDVFGSLRLDDRSSQKNNRSTSCLVYVPSDPWTKMEATNGKVKKRGENRMKKLMDVKSLSRPDLDFNDDDPWVYDESRKSTKDKKCATYRSTHSKSLHFESKSGTARPRLQRSKSPSFIADENPIKNPPSSPNNLSPKDLLSSISPKLGYHAVPDENNDEKSQKKKNQFLNVSNPNLLQPRHSFSTSTSTSSQKDDELTLNIRRLSEQIKHSSNYASYGNFPNAGAVTATTTSPKSGEMDKKSSSLLSDSLLETTC
ncbi:CLUMA_CG008382, isoform A [Clunio marinus]|uniref:CLUMA_CG008382, isoform A n=1 Tax=Clunio marinus TaxID=568069 RepID=A0A1J1I560_9DIPT|nr:CLUMA_CG008382, isoform A [Clunio marinus]